MKYRILILSDLHFGESRESTTNSGIVRQANTQAEDLFKSLVPRFKELKPDLVVNLGDNLRDTYVKEIDARNLSKAIELVNSISAPVINLIGNHELRAFSYEEVSKIFNTVSKNGKLFGVYDLGEIQIVWLDLLLDNNGRAYITSERSEWISNVVNKEKPTVVFTHYSLLPIDGSGSFYFENEPEGMVYKDYKDINMVLGNLNLKVSVNAHVHLLTHQELNDIHYISNPAFSENIAAEKYPENNPGIYSTLEIDENKFVFTSYSGSFCFAKIQGKLD